jgi:hypothetical protein
MQLDRLPAYEVADSPSSHEIAAQLKDIWSQKFRMYDPKMPFCQLERVVKWADEELERTAPQPQQRHIRVLPAMRQAHSGTLRDGMHGHDEDHDGNVMHGLQDVIDTDAKDMSEEAQLKVHLQRAIALPEVDDSAVDPSIVDK